MIVKEEQHCLEQALVHKGFSLSELRIEQICSLVFFFSRRYFNVIGSYAVIQVFSEFLCMVHLERNTSTRFLTGLTVLVD